MDYNDFFIYDPESPTFLVNKITRANTAKAGDPSGYKSVRGFSVYVNGKQRQSGRIIWEMHHGPIPDGMLVGFKDGDKFNLRIENLILQSQRDKSLASEQHVGASGVRGVIPVKGRYKAQMKFMGKMLHLGLYDDLASATTARIQATKLVRKVK